MLGSIRAKIYNTNMICLLDINGECNWGKIEKQADGNWLLAPNYLHPPFQQEMSSYQSEPAILNSRDLLAIADDIEDWIQRRETHDPEYLASPYRPIRARENPSEILMMCVICPPLEDGLETWLLTHSVIHKAADNGHATDERRVDTGRAFIVVITSQSHLELYVQQIRHAAQSDVDDA